MMITASRRCAVDESKVQWATGHLSSGTSAYHVISLRKIQESVSEMLRAYMAEIVREHSTTIIVAIIGTK
jgi:hypothetical protein